MDWLLMPCLLCGACRVTAQHTVAEQYLFQSINAERAAAGLSPLVWNPYLTQAAQAHAMQMRSQQAISHQFRSEAGLAERAAATGTRFSRVAENVATSSSVLEMHTAWMHSQGHRANILDAQVNSVGISVVSSGHQLWGVEDFARDVQPLSYEQQEATVAQLVAARGARDVTRSDAARATCRLSSGYAGDRPVFVVRFTSVALDHLPVELATRLARRDYGSVAVGACDLKPASSFAQYRVAVILYP